MATSLADIHKEDARVLLEEGMSFLKTSTSWTKKENFNAELIYNLFMMGAEKVLVSRLIGFGAMPVHHTMQALLEGLAYFEKIPETVSMPLLELEKAKDICSIVSITAPDLSPDLYPLMDEACAALAIWQ